jgi:hypothetical protein
MLLAQSFRKTENRAEVLGGQLDVAVFRAVEAPPGFRYLPQVPGIPQFLVYQDFGKIGIYAYS